MDPAKAKRSLRRFRHRIASYRRRFIANVHRATGMFSAEPARVVSRIPTRQEKRVLEAFRQDLHEAELT
jgi:hypothetical protein